MPQDRSGRPSNIDIEAANWHARMSEPTSEDEVAEFEAWLCSAPENARAYDEIGRIATLGEQLPVRLLDDGPARMRGRRLRPALGIAAALALIIAGGSWLATQGTSTAMAAVSNAGPAVRGVQLRDATVVILDRATRLDLPLDTRSHDIMLTTGRARIDARRRAAPLSVGVAAVGVRAESAVFDVALAAGVVTISVLAGSVEIDPDTGTALPGRATLSAGQVATVRSGKLATTPVLTSELRWPESRLGFDGVPLREVVARANRRGNPRIGFEPYSLGERRVTGVLDLRDTRSLSRRLAAALDLKVTETSAGILLHY